MTLNKVDSGVITANADRDRQLNADGLELRFSKSPRRYANG